MQPLLGLGQSFAFEPRVIFFFCCILVLRQIVSMSMKLQALLALSRVQA
jgi:hypothetical protein